MKKIQIYQKNLLDLAYAIENTDHISCDELSKWLLKHTNKQVMLVETEMIEDFVRYVRKQEISIRDFYDRWPSILYRLGN